MLKKLMICLIAVLLSFSLVACGGEDETTTANNQTDTGTPEGSDTDVSTPEGSDTDESTPTENTGDVYTDANGDPWTPWA